MVIVEDDLVDGGGRRRRVAGGACGPHPYRPGQAARGVVGVVAPARMELWPRHQGAGGVVVVLLTVLTLLARRRLECGIDGWLLAVWGGPLVVLREGEEILHCGRRVWQQIVCAVTIRESLV